MSLPELPETLIVRRNAAAQDTLHVVEPMADVADRYAHRLALELECVLADRPGYYDKAMQVLGEYRRAMNAIHERHSPTHMGEPLLPTSYCDNKLIKAIEMQPTKVFLKFAQFVVSDELNHAKPALPQEVEKRLWAAAQFDVLTTSGGLPALDHAKEGCGFVGVDDDLYVTVISDALEPLLTWHGAVV